MLGFRVSLAVCAGLGRRGTSHASRDRNKTESHRSWSGPMDYVEYPISESWKSYDTDCQREAEQWLAYNEYEGLAQSQSAVAQSLVAPAKDHYSGDDAVRVQ